MGIVRSLEATTMLEPQWRHFLMFRSAIFMVQLVIQSDSHQGTAFNDDQ